MLAKNHAPERKESFYGKIKVSASVNFEVVRLKKMMKTSIVVAVDFTYFESLTVYRSRLCV